MKFKTMHKFRNSFESNFEFHMSRELKKIQTILYLHWGSKFPILGIGLHNFVYKTCFAFYKSLIKRLPNFTKMEES